MSKVHELLGLKPNEKFYCEELGINRRMYLDEVGVLRSFPSGTTEPQIFLVKIMENPDGIVRLPKYTKKQIEIARHLFSLGLNWVTKNYHDAMFAFENEPEKHGYAWRNKSGNLNGGYASGGKLLYFEELVNPWTIPFDIRKMLDEVDREERDLHENTCA